MQRISTKLENCYGIRSLSYLFDFSDQKPYSIYAPNGFMKTSFSKTFLGLSTNQPAVDLIFPGRVSRRFIDDETGQPVQPENVFVIEPYNESYKSERASLLLVNRELKEKHDDALKEIESKKNDLLDKLKKISGLTGKTSTPETELLKIFGAPSLYPLMESLEQLTSSVDTRFAALIYAELFNEKTVPFLDSGKIKIQLKEYIEKYDELVGKSEILSKAFNHYHAKTVQKNLSDNGFFAAKHSVNLFNGKSRDEYVSSDALEERIEQERKKILSSDELQTKFDAIDRKLTNAELRRFRDYLFDNKDVVSNLANFQDFQRQIWVAYLGENRELLQALIVEYKKGKVVIEEAIAAAKKERTNWEKVIETFNRRFSVPFRLIIENQDDVILKEQVPKIAFKFEDGEGDTQVEQKALLTVLSQGEKRALYLLNILFELTVRKLAGTPTVVIVDDVADSFDYKNKYAIVEYLQEISDHPHFALIFLSHNFDFHRTVASRLGIPRGKCLAVSKVGRDITLSEQTYQKNPFVDHWKKNLSVPRYLVSSIPFVRNLAEYCGNDAEEYQLTCLLHIKTESHEIKVRDLQAIFITILKDQAALVLPDPERTVLDLIFQVAEEICADSTKAADLESKIVLSIAIRLYAETFMIGKLADPTVVEAIRENQTRRLYGYYSSRNPMETKSLEVLELVNLMTPEAIHVNSFMYEPILDMSSDSLIRLFDEVKQL